MPEWWVSLHGIDALCVARAGNSSAATLPQMSNKFKSQTRMNGLDYTQQYSQLSNASQPQYSEEFKNSIWLYSLIFMISPIIPLEDFSLSSALPGVCGIQQQGSPIIQRIKSAAAMPEWWVSLHGLDALLCGQDRKFFRRPRHRQTCAIDIAKFAIHIAISLPLPNCAVDSRHCNCLQLTFKISTFLYIPAYIQDVLYICGYITVSRNTSTY